MNFKQTIFVIFYSAISLASSCRKKDEPIKEFLPLDKEFLSYFAFPAGSYWVYEDTVNKHKDSAYIIKNFIITETSNKTKEIYDYEILALHEIILNDTFYGNAYPVWMNDDKNNKNIDYRFEQIYDFNYGAWSLVKNNIVQINTFGEEPDYIFFQYFGSVYLNNVNYIDVIKVTHNVQAYNNPIKSIWFCKNVGVIQRDFFDGTSWELQKYYINP